MQNCCVSEKRPVADKKEKKQYNINKAIIVTFMYNQLIILKEVN